MVHTRQKKYTFVLDHRGLFPSPERDTFVLGSQTPSPSSRIIEGSEFRRLHEGCSLGLRISRKGSEISLVGYWAVFFPEVVQGERGGGVWPGGSQGRDLEIDLWGRDWL